MPEIESHRVEVDGLKLHYTECGSGPPVLLLHGWPTSSFLWRRVMPPMASAGLRAIALDLPGFGLSDKPLDVSYSLRYFERVIGDFLDALDIEQTGLVVHDLGGPLGLYWACKSPHRVNRLALLNTLVYPEMSWAVVAFVTSVRVPGLRSLMTSQWGLKKALHVGVANRHRLAADAVAGVQAPFRSQDARRALAKAGCNVSPKGLQELAEKLPRLKIPVRLIYGEKDRILPDVAQTMSRVQRDLPQSEITALAECGHFLQEEEPEKIGGMLAEFFVTD